MLGKEQCKFKEERASFFRKVFFASLILSLFFIFVSNLEARESDFSSFDSQDRVKEKSSSKRKRKRVSSITFEDELIQGDIKNPYVSYFSKESSLKHKKIIKLRNDFLKEMKETAELWPRSGK